MDKSETEEVYLNFKLLLLFDVQKTPFLKENFRVFGPFLF